MKRFVKKAGCLLTCLFLLAQSFILCASAEGNAAPQVAEGFEMVCENQRLALYLNRDTCFFAVGDKTTGKVLYSNPLNAEEDESASNRYKMEMLAQFAFDYREANEKETSYLNSYTASVRRGNFDIETQVDGFTIRYDLNNVNATLPLSVKLADEYITVSVDLTGLEAQINSLMLLPYFGCGDSKTNGYTFVPDGSGALIHFNNHKSGMDGYSQWVYGSDPADVDTGATFIGEKISLPVFGAASDNGSYLAILEEGAEQAAIQAYTSGNRTMFNNVYPSFTLIPSNTLVVGSGVQTNVFGSDYLTSEISVRYYPLGAGEEDYAGMAAIYREYLLDNGLIAQTNGVDSYGMLLETYGAVKKSESILGFPITVTKKLTTFEECLGIVQALEAKGGSGIRVEYNNWNKEGISGKIASGSKPLSSLGGVKGWETLRDYLSGQGGSVYLNVEAMTFESGTLRVSARSDSIKKLGDITVEEYPVKRNTLTLDESGKPRLFLALSKLERMLNDLFAGFGKWGNRAIGFTDLGRLSYADFSEKQTVFRGDAIGRVNRILLDGRDSYDSILLQNANAYSFAYAGYISDLPTESSGFSIVDESVPFLQMLLHGLVRYAAPSINMSADPNEAVLKAIETGSELSFTWIYEDPTILRNTSLNTLFASDYRLWLDFAGESYRKAAAALESVSGLQMTGHRRLADEVYETTYENGTRVLVNYGGAAFTTEEGLSVGAENYLLIGGEA